MQLINAVLGEIVDVIQACSMPMNCLSFMEIVTEFVF